MSTPQIKALFEERSKAAHDLRALYDAAGTEDLTAEQVQTEERLHAVISNADERIKNLLSVSEGEERAAEAWKDLGNREPDAAPADEVRSDEDILRAVARGEQRYAEFGFEQRGTATLIKGTAAIGGNTVPTSFYDTLVESMTEVSTVLTAGATVLRTAGGEKILVPTATAFPEAALVAENAQIGNQDATFGQKELDAYKYAFTMQASSELLADTGVDLTEFLARRGGEALGNAVGTASMTGTGSGQPQGIYASSGGLGTVASASGSVAAGFRYEDIIDLVHSITRPYRNGASFIAGDHHIKGLRKLREGSGTGQFLWQPAITAGEPDTLAGFPVYTDPAVPTATTNGSKGIAFGNWKRAVMVRFAGPVRVEASDDFRFDYDVTTWRFILRFDSEVVDPAAGKVLTYTT